MSFGSRFAAALTATAMLAAAFAAGAWATHSRPGSATPIRASLVPAYAQCTSPSTTHVLPLALPSCDPPAQVSDILTTGSNGQGAGSMKLTVFCHPPETFPPPCRPGDGEEEQDVAVDTNISDVRCLKPVPGCSGTGADYSGSLLALVTLRLTDHDGAGIACGNGTGAPPCVNVTTEDANFGVLTGPASCVETAGSAGGRCAFATSMNAVLPGTVKERQMMVTSVLAAKVLDLGEDGDAGPNCPQACGNGDETTVLATGLFLP
jgi:hypothetical protein